MPCTLCAMNWIKMVEQASTIETLLDVVNDYILQQPDEHWSWIPRGARPKLVASEEELHLRHHGFALELAAATNPNFRMQDLAVFFLRASARAHQIHIKAETSNPSNENQFQGKKARTVRRR